MLQQPLRQVNSVLPALFTTFIRNNSSLKEKGGQQWSWMVSKGHQINPCNSPLHPAVVDAGIHPSGDELSVQEAYTPKSECFGCGPCNPDGLRLRSTRIRNGLEAEISIPTKFCAFPGIVNGGVVSTIMDCHGNWTAAVALMDRSFLSKPPLTLTASMLVAYKELTPPEKPLLVRSTVNSIQDGSQPGLGKVTVEVDIHLYERLDGGGTRVLATATGIFKRLGALRAL